MEISARMQQINSSPTLAITARAKELAKQGREIISLGAGEPDFATPIHIRKAAAQAIEDGYTTYTSVFGLKAVREVICAYLATENNLNYQPEEIIISTGAKQALFNAIQAIIDPGDEVILPAPFWVSYPEQVKFAGGKPKVVETEEADNFKLTAAKFSAAINEATKAIILNSPNNPTGAVYTKQELEEIAQIAVKHNIIVISDEIYNRINYDIDPVSIASLGKEIKKQTVVINGVSKAYAMTGWRIGYAAGCKEIIEAMGKLQSHSTSNANSIAQMATKAALSGDQTPIDKMVDAFSKRRDIIVDGINSISGLKVIRPAGAFYIFVNVKDALDKEISGTKVSNDQQLAALLLEEVGVATVPGSYFGKDGYLRLSYATSTAEIEAALEKIANLLN